MRTLIYYLRIYLLIEAQYIKSRMQYRADFVISFFGIIIASMATMLTYRVLFESIPDLAGWTFHEMLFITAFYLLAIFPLQFFFDQVWNLHEYVQEGTFIKYYLRPLNIMFYYMSEMVDLKGFGQIILGTTALLYASSKLGIVWTLPTILLLLALLFGASLVVISLLLLGASAAFWITNCWPLMALSSRLREFAPYPMTVFDGFFRFLFTYVMPIGFIAFYPSQIFLRPGEVTYTAYLAPIVGVLSFGLAYFVWSKGVDRWAGTGS